MELRQVELFIRRPGHPDRRMLLPRGEQVVGRAEDVDVVLSDVGVSRKHAKIVVGAEGVRVEDLQSGNGTFVGSRRVTTAAINDGDEVRIDPFMLTFRLVRADAKPAAARLALPNVARLEVISRHAIGKGSFPLPVEGVVSLGRAETNDIVLPEPQSSRNHAEVLGTGGTWIVRDRKSANGTLVNDVPVIERRLQEGDRIKIGAVELRFTQTLAPVEAEFGDRTENFDAVLHGTVEQAPEVRPMPAAGRVPTRMSTSATLVPGEAAPAPFEGTRTLPPGELPREMPFSRRTDSMPPEASAGSGSGAWAAPAPRAPAPARSAPRERRDVAPRPRGFLSNPVNQISLVVVVFAMGLVGLFVLKELADVVMARMEPPRSDAAVATSTVPAPARAPSASPPPASTASASPSPASTASASPPSTSTASEPSATPPASAASEPSATPSASAASEPSASPPPTSSPSASTASTTAAAGSAHPAPTSSASALSASTGSEADRLVADGRRLLDEGRLYEGAADFFKALQSEPTNTAAEHWGYAACELITLEHMRASMKGVAVPVEPPTRGR